MAKSLLVLFGHGARDPRWAQPFRRLQQMLQAQLADVQVELAFLELMTPSLPDVVRQAAAAGCSRVAIVPVFFGQGGHVLRDLPLLVEQLRNDHAQIDFTLAQAVGESDAVLAAIARYCIDALGDASTE